MPLKKAERKLESSKAHEARMERKRILEPAVLAVVSALGGFEDIFVEEDEDDEKNSGRGSKPKLQKVYKLGDECLGCLKDLKKFWRLDEDDEDRTVARLLYDSQILPKDLLPIINSLDLDDKKDFRVSLLCSDLISALTWPIDVASELKEMDELLDQENKRELKQIDFSGLISAQLSYKRDILRSGALQHIFRLIVPSLQKGKRERTEKDENIISLILHIIRNLVALKDKPCPIGESSTSADDYQLQSELILQMSQFGIFDFLIHLSHGSNRFDIFGAWNIIALDIWHLLFRGINAEDLVDAESFSKTDEEGQTVKTLSTSARRLEALLAEEEKQKRREARKAPTRHSRFGTTISVHAGDRKYTLHRQSDITTSLEHALDSRKKGKKKPVRLRDELGTSIELTTDAMKVLRKVATEFIESAFNPFFGSILQDIQMERDKVKETDTIRFMSLFGFFLQYFLLLRDREKRVGIPPDSEEGHDFDLIASLIEPGCIRYILEKIKANVEEKPMPAVEVHAAVNCLLHQLLVIDGLMASGVASYIDAATLIQDKLYYDETSLEVVVQLLSGYTTQSHKFLENIIFVATVFLKMLERHSKSQDHMFVRKKKPNKKSQMKSKGNLTEGQQEDAEAGLGVGDEEEAEFEAMEAQNAQRYAEHKFEFEKFQAKFAREPVLNTLLLYLTGHREFNDPEQLKRVVRLLHRIAVNAKADGLFFKVSTFDTLSSLLDDRASSPRNSSYDDLWKLIDYILKQFFKSIRENPFMLVECFFPSRKTKAGARNIENSDSDADSLVLTKSKSKSKRKPLKLPAEIVVTPGLTWSQKLGVAIGLLVDNNKSDLVEQVKDTLRLVSAARTAIVLITDGSPDEDENINIQAWLDEPNEELSEALKEKFAKPSQAALEKFEDHEVKSEDEDFQEGLARDPQLHLFLRLLSWESTEDEGRLHWSIPKSQLHTELNVNLKVIDYFLLNPLDHNGKSAAELVKKKRKSKASRQRRTRREKSADLNEEEGTLDGDSDDEEGSRRKRQAKKQQEVKQYQSAQFIADSDDEDDPERDARFFEQERLLRERINQGAILGMGAPAANANPISTRKIRAKPAKRSRQIRKASTSNDDRTNNAVAIRSRSSSDDEMDIDMLNEDEDEVDLSIQKRSSREASPELSQEEGNSDDEGEKGRRTTTTSITTPTHSSNSSQPVLSQIKNEDLRNRKRSLIASVQDDDDDDDDDDDEMEIDELEVSPRRVKARKIIVLDSDEE
ncbi:timeless protein-domain-containing protein [Melampsora americana]|nr:timeless protein-domain-containing protein [Melampsora americana]